MGGYECYYLREIKRGRQRERAWKKYQHVNYLQRIKYSYNNTSPLITVNYKCNIIKANEIIKHTFRLTYIERESPGGGGYVVHLHLGKDHLV